MNDGQLRFGTTILDLPRPTADLLPFYSTHSPIMPNPRTSRPSQSRPEQANEVNPTPVGPPRLDPYKRLLCRFYEPLILLEALGKTRGNHIMAPRDADVLQSARRRFLRNLSFICDYEKGGRTCTAIGLEECKDCYNFWFASNAANTGRITDFLESALEALSKVPSLSSDQRQTLEAEFTRKCIDFASKRVKDEASFMRRAIESCLNEQAIWKG
jgi:hypothetical protein